MEKLPEKTLSMSRLTSPSLDLDMLKTFIAIAESGSMTKAAKMVFRTPAAVSMQVKKLEELLQCTLLTRKAREILLTPNGETLLRAARKMIRLNDEVVAEFLAPRLEGTVTIGLPEQYAANELPTILSHFAKMYPSVQVDVVMGRSVELRQKFEQGEIDLTLLSTNLANDSQVNATTVRLERLVWAAHADSSAIKKRPLPLALAEYGCSWRSLAIQALDNAGMDYRIAYSSESCTGQLAAVKADLAIAAIPEGLVTQPLIKIEHSDTLPEIGFAQTVLMISSTANEPAVALKSFIEKVLDGKQLKHSTDSERGLSESST